MQINRVQVHNFRLLTSAEMALEQETTLVVGRNNSGKTSLNEVMRSFFEEPNPAFRIEDFSIASFESFYSALGAKLGGDEEQAVRDLLPKIELRVHIGYDPGQPLGPLGDFIINLDPASTEALIVFSYELKAGRIDDLFADETNAVLDEEEKKRFFKALRDRIPNLYETKIWAEDPLDETNRKDVTHKEIQKLIRTGFINAQRGLDDKKHQDTDILAKTLESLFKTAMSPNANEHDKLIADALKAAVTEIQSTIDSEFSGHLKGLLPTFKQFGYPGLNGPELQTETTLDVEKLLSDHTKLQYVGYNGIALPEGYNGLGIRNLLFILLKIIGYYRSFQAEEQEPGIHLIFIEEPEAHLHPQMQEVFIRQLSAIASSLSVEDGTNPWPVQFVVSTHSSHISNAASFKSIRYFMRYHIDGSNGMHKAAIKDLRNELQLADPNAEEFLHKYLTLTKCDLFFADKAVLVEGMTERLLLPVIIQKIETLNLEAPRLSNQFVTTMEVSGAYAHLFLPLLRFLELPFLVITDIDSVGADNKKCMVHVGTKTSNACIRNWFANAALTPAQLLGKSDQERTADLGRIAYQIPEQVNDPCGRTFEDMFILSNPTLFGLTATTPNALAEEAYVIANGLDKSGFAIKYAIEDTSWNAPHYVVQGLSWLANMGNTAMPPVETEPIAGQVAEPPEGGNGN